jgi:hypothetical protein
VTARFICRPTERAAITAACRSARPTPPVHLILADLIAAHRAGDQHGVNLCAHLVARAALEVGTP